MKAAIITEEQIKAIENAMMYFVCGDDGKTSTGRYQADKVFDIVKSLKVQEPVAWGLLVVDEVVDCICPEEHDKEEGEYKIPLYAGEQP